MTPELPPRSTPLQPRKRAIVVGASSGIGAALAVGAPFRPDTAAGCVAVALLLQVVAKGGKLLLAHGLQDVLVCTRATEMYYQMLQSQFGPENVDKFARYYEIPGLGHALSAAFTPGWDSLTALENWVEKGIAPRNQIATDTAVHAGRTRPLCEYPTWPKYNGSGDVNSASSFTCSED